jgi:hypothetical protein
VVRNVKISNRSISGIEAEGANLQIAMEVGRESPLKYT